jgi:hypothetical protein
MDPRLAPRRSAGGVGWVIAGVVTMVVCILFGLVIGFWA